MQFGPNQNTRFESTDGAYSTVTEREHDDSQVTLTDHEARIVLTHFGEASILRGSVKSDTAMAEKEFALFPTGRSIKLNVNYPKAKGNELRLYLNKNFKPESGLVLFFFPKDGRLWIGTMSENEWRAGAADVVRDDSDSVFQEALVETNEIKIATLKGRDIYVRDRSVALQSMEKSGYVCELNNTHKLFISRRTGKRYLEAHHLIPMAFQAGFKKNLDTVPNVYCLCPNCHRAVHYAKKETTKLILEKLIAKRNILTDFHIDRNDLYALYGVEDID